MRFVEFDSGLRTYVNKEEQELIARVFDDGEVLKRDLTEREQVIANKLTTKDVLIRSKVNDQIQFTISKTADYTGPLD